MKHLAWFLTLALLVIQQCNLIANVEAKGRVLREGFISVRGTHFMLNGSPYYANGFNAYWLMFMASDPSKRHLVSDVFQQASSRGLFIARTWAFNDGGYQALQTSPGSYNEQTFQGLDFVVAEARKYGIKLIMSFVNNYYSLGGRRQYVNWAKSQGQNVYAEDDFYTNSVIKGYYKNHVRTVLNRRNTINGVEYKNDPTIMAWELMNEPRCPSDTSGRTLQAWITEMAAHVKSIDRNHLLEVGLEGFYGHSHPEKLSNNPSFNIGTDFIANNQIPGIDFATVHTYPDQWLPGESDAAQLDFVNKWMATHIQDSQNILRKPLLFAEFGKSQRDSGFSTYKRDQLYAGVYNAIYASAKRGGPAAGGLFWQLVTDGMNSYGDDYGINFSQNPSTTNLITQESHKLNLIRKIYARRRNEAFWKRARETRAREARRGQWGARNWKKPIGL